MCFCKEPLEQIDAALLNSEWSSICRSENDSTQAWMCQDEGNPWIAWEIAEFSGVFFDFVRLHLLLESGIGIQQWIEA